MTRWSIDDVGEADPADVAEQAMPVDADAGQFAIRPRRTSAPAIG